LLAIVIMTFLSVLVFSFTYKDLEDVFLSPSSYFFTSTPEYCSLAMPYTFDEDACFALTPGFWKNRICKGNPQSLSDETVDQYLTIIRQNSQFFSNLNSRNKACTYLKRDYPQFNRARKFFLANMFNFASGGLKLSTPVNSEYSSASTFAGVIQESDNILVNYPDDNSELERIGNLNEDICQDDATDCLHEFIPEDGLGPGGCQTPCKDFDDFKNMMNKLKKLEHTFMLIPFSLESMEKDKPIFTFYDDHFVLNDFILTLGFFSWDSTTSGTLSDYQDIFNNNEITHECVGDNCTTDIRILTDCNFYLNRTIWHFWYWFEYRDGPDDPLKRVVYSAMKIIFYSFLEDGELSKDITVHPLDQKDFKINFNINISEFISTAFSTQPYALYNGLYEGTIGLDDAVRTLYILIIGAEDYPSVPEEETVTQSTPQPSPAPSSSGSPPSSSGSSLPGSSSSGSSSGGGGGAGASSTETPMKFTATRAKSIRSKTISGTITPSDITSASDSTTSSESGSGPLHNILGSSKSEIEPVTFSFGQKLNFALFFSILIVSFYLAKEYLPLDNLVYEIRKKLFK
ncbi:hypothetical protein KY345_03620, partial [Candidatus Woesearchaeota archaeon]|nr:hypothetical protein [Candidatus Woesearchaeota archaeon]